MCEILSLENRIVGGMEHCSGISQVPMFRNKKHTKKNELIGYLN